MTALPGSRPALRALVLDDDVMVCLFLERSLGRLGFTVASENTAADALERLAAEDFDVVVSDLNLAGLDGLAFTRQVIGLRPEVPVVLITGSSTTGLAVEAVRAGAWDLLTKPVDARLLAVSMSRACAHRRRLHQRRGASAPVCALTGTE